MSDENLSQIRDPQIPVELQRGGAEQGNGLADLVIFQELVGIHSTVNDLDTDHRPRVQGFSRHFTFGHESGNITTTPHLSSNVRKTVNQGDYARILREETIAKRTYRFTSTMITSCYLLQVLVGATITALAAVSVNDSATGFSITGRNTPITILGAINTALAALLTFLKGQGLPNRPLQYWNEMRRVREFCEFRERQFEMSVQGLDPFEEAQRVRDMYNAARRDQEDNYPDTYVAKGEQDQLNKLEKAFGPAQTTVNNMLGRGNQNFHSTMNGHQGTAGRQHVGATNTALPHHPRSNIAQGHGSNGQRTQNYHGIRHPDNPAFRPSGEDVSENNHQPQQPEVVSEKDPEIKSAALAPVSNQGALYSQYLGRETASAEEPHVEPHREALPQERETASVEEPHVEPHREAIPQERETRRSEQADAVAGTAMPNTGVARGQVHPHILAQGMRGARTPPRTQPFTENRSSDLFGSDPSGYDGKGRQW